MGKGGGGGVRRGEIEDEGGWGTGGKKEKEKSIKAE